MTTAGDSSRGASSATLATRNEIPGKTDFTSLPLIFILPAFLEGNEQDSVETLVSSSGGSLTFDAKEASIFLGKLKQKRRALFELRKLGVWTEEDDINPNGGNEGHDSKRRKVESQSHPSQAETTASSDTQSTLPPQTVMMPAEGEIFVLSLDWLHDSVSQKQMLPPQDYLIVAATRVQAPAYGLDTSHRTKERTIPARRSTPTVPQQKEDSSQSWRHGNMSQVQRHPVKTERVPLLTQTTTEHDENLAHDLPDMPEWVNKGIKYACQRSTPNHSPNEEFINQLKVIRTARELTLDEIGVRAYSTSIAAIAAYPYSLTSPQEILMLPGCEKKIAALFAEWKNYGRLQAVEEIQADEHLKTLQLFYDIWGVGAHTANVFYDRGWRDIDDVVEYGWNNLTREQQIGVKFYDEFKLRMSRAEVEQIHDIVADHMRRVCATDPTGIRTCIVGGYRRGNNTSGDADIIVSHVQDKLTLGMVDELVRSLYREKWITHNLKVYFSNTRRSQAALPYEGRQKSRPGFDTLDKAFIVWQDPRFDEQAAIDGKNPNPHRRVDIIVAPWSKIGCAVTGWTSGTTFQRDLRRYAKNVKGWKFDSSGVRSRVTGKEIDLQGPCDDIELAERRVFQGLGLDWREPWERCTY